MLTSGTSMNGSSSINVGEIALIFANMLGQAMQSDARSFTEVNHDIEDSQQSYGESGLHLYPPIDDGSGPPSPGEYGAPICSQGESVTAGVDGGYDPCAGRRPGGIGGTNRRTQRLQDSGGRCFPEESGRGVCPGGIPSGPI